MYITLNGVEYDVEYTYVPDRYYIDSVDCIRRKFLDEKIPEVRKLIEDLEQELACEVEQMMIDEKGDMEANMAREDKI